MVSLDLIGRCVSRVDDLILLILNKVNHSLYSTYPSIANMYQDL